MLQQHVNLRNKQRFCILKLCIKTIPVFHLQSESNFWNAVTNAAVSKETWCWLVWISHFIRFVQLYPPVQKLQNTMASVFMMLLLWEYAASFLWYQHPSEELEQITGWNIIALLSIWRQKLD
jgi:hypothetical protein